MSAIAIVSLAIAIFLVVSAFIVLFVSGVDAIMNSTDPYKGDRNDN